MSKIVSALVLLAVASVAAAQSTPSITPSETPSVIPSQTPSVTPSQTPSIAVGGLSKCENLLGDEKEKCQKQERAGSGGSAGAQPPYSFGSGAGATAPQSTTPSGAAR